MMKKAKEMRSITNTARARIPDGLQKSILWAAKDGVSCIKINQIGLQKKQKEILENLGYKVVETGKLKNMYKISW